MKIAKWREQSERQKQVLGFRSNLTSGRSRHTCAASIQAIVARILLADRIFFVQE